MNGNGAEGRDLVLHAEPLYKGLGTGLLFFRDQR